MRDAFARPVNEGSAERGGRRGALVTGALVGIGVVGFLDEAILHQLLQWHTFYWGTDQHGRTLSDGLFHVATTALLPRAGSA